MTPAYFDRYPGIAFRREDGILELRLHTRGGPALWGYWGGLHRELGDAFRAVAADPDNQVVILTGTGDSFCAAFDDQGEAPAAMNAAAWDVILSEGTALLENFLAIPVPVIAAVNGPVFIHSELPVLADIVLAAEHAAFADKAHTIGGVVPGDGVHTIWPALLGPNRGRYFLLTGQEIAAAEALALGVVGEVLPAEALLPRAWEHARRLAQLPPLARRYTRHLLTRQLRERLAAELTEGLTLEGLAILSTLP